MNKVIIALLFGSASAYPVPRPISMVLDEYDMNTQDAPHMVTDKWVNSMSQHRQYVRKNPNAYFGSANTPGDTFFNTRYGDIPDQIDTHHDDEPIVMGQATLSSGSDSTDSEDENDKAAHEGALEEANRLGQVHRHGYSRNIEALQLRFVNPEDALAEDDYAEQVAQIRDSGDKELKSFRTRQEQIDEKKQSLLAQSGQNARKFSDDLAEADAIFKNEPVATPQKQTYFAQKKNDVLIDGYMLASKEFADQDTYF